MSEQAFVRMTCDHKEHRGQVVPLATADTNWRGCMYSRTTGAAMLDLPFSLRPECPKCGGDRFRFSYEAFRTRESMRAIGEPKDEHLLVTCERCGYTVTMQTKDAK